VTGEAKADRALYVQPVQKFEYQNLQKKFWYLTALIMPGSNHFV